MTFKVSRRKIGRREYHTVTTPTCTYLFRSSDGVSSFIRSRMGLK